MDGFATGESMFLMSDKMSFRSALIHMCISFFFPFFLHGWENVTDAIMHSSTRTVNSTRMANPSTAAEAAIGPHVKWR